VKKLGIAQPGTTHEPELLVQEVRLAASGSTNWSR